MTGSARLFPKPWKRAERIAEHPSDDGLFGAESSQTWTAP